MQSNNKRLLVTAWLLIGILLWGIGQDLFALVPNLELTHLAGAARAEVFLIYVFVAFFAWLYLGVRFWKHGLPNTHGVAVAIKRSLSPRPLWLRKTLFVVFLLFPPVLIFFSPLAFVLSGFWLRVCIIFSAALLASCLIDPDISRADWIHTYFIVAVVSGVVYLCGSFFTLVTAYPFSLSWSEGNRLWDYSIFFGSHRYQVLPGEQLNAFASKGRGILWGFPFLISNIGIFGVRLWVELVKIWPYLLLPGLLLFDRWQSRDGWRTVLLFAAWGLVFLHQGPIYSTMLIFATITLVGVRSKNIMVAALLVALAGFFSNESRLHWAYAPGLWAGMLALLQIESPSFRRDKLPQLLRPIVLGLSGYLGGHVLPLFLRLSNQAHWKIGDISLVVDPTKTETFKQPLLWDRLLPNPTFLPGVLLGLLWAVLPVFVVLFWLRKQGAWRMNAMQLSAAGVILLAFLGVGLTASVKIGGGGDLHNMDIFLVTILMLVASAWPEIIEKIRHGKQSINSKLLVYFMLVMPLFYTVYWSGSVLVLATPAETAAAIRVIQKHASAAQSYGQVLFLDQRQLLTFGYVQDIIMVSDYEKKKLIDKAMSANAEYFSPFYSALANHRFSLIVSERIFLSPGDPNGPFAEENDAWMQWVAIPLLEYYQPLVTLKAVGIQLLVPRDNPSP